jgi:hypothetical protein
MNLIFLDIDGVLNSEDSVMASVGCTTRTEDQIQALEKLKQTVGVGKDLELDYGPSFSIRTIDPVSVGLLNRLIRDTDAKIVLSSTHRKYFSRPGQLVFGSQVHLDVLRLYLKSLGIVGDLFGITNSLNTKRGFEVQEFVFDIEVHFLEHINSYVILDDDSDFLPGQPLVKIDNGTGFKFRHFAKASLILQKEKPVVPNNESS